MSWLKTQSTVHKTQHNKLKTAQHESLQNPGADLRCSGWVSRYYATSGTRRVAHVCINLVSISVGHIRGKMDKIVVTSIGTYLSLFVKHIFHNRTVN